MLKIKNFLLSAFLALTLLFSLAPLAGALDCSNTQSLSTKQQIQCGVNQANGGEEATPPGQSINNTLNTVINILSVVVGIVAVIMLIVGGFRYITSGGSSEKVTSAKNTILYAIIGLIIALLAQAIVRFVLKSATTGSNSSNSSSTMNCPPNDPVCHR